MSDWQQLARIDSLLDLRRPVEAEKAAREFLRQDPESSYGFRLLSRALTDQGVPRAALEAADRAVSLEPDNADGQVIRANALLLLQRPDLAVSAAAEARRLSPHSWTTHYTLARALHGQGRIRDALASARHTVSLAPHLPDPHIILGVCLRRLHDEAGARRAYGEALRLDPGNATALNNLAALETDRGRLARAARHLRSGLGSNPQLSSLHRNHELLWALLVRRVQAALACGCIVLTVEAFSSAAYVVRAATGAGVTMTFLATSWRVVRELPRGARSPSYAWTALRAVEVARRVGLIFLLVDFLLLAWCPLAVAQLAVLLTICLTRPIGFGIGIAISGFLNTGESMLNRTWHRILRVIRD